MPRPRRSATQTVQDASIIENPNFDFTPQTSQETINSINTQQSIQTVLTSLPESLNVNYPDVSTMMPTDWFRPSSSSVPQTDDATFQTELKVAHEQNNSIQLLSANMDNAIELGKVAVKATKLGKQVAEYLVGLEEIKAVGVRLRAAQAATSNEERKVLLVQEKGNQLDNKLAGERIKTGIELQKNSITQLEVDYLNRLKPVKESEWMNKLEAAKSKAQQALQGSRTGLEA